MKFEEYWDRLVARNDGLRDLDRNMTLTVDSFKRSMRQAFDMGLDEGKTGTPKADSLFERVFGRKG